MSYEDADDREAESECNNPDPTCISVCRVCSEKTVVIEKGCTEGTCLICDAVNKIGSKIEVM